MNWCYIACFIDTDGCVGIYPINVKRKLKTQVKFYHYERVVISFYNDDKNVLEIMKKFIGTKATVSSRKRRKNGKVGYGLWITDQTLCKWILEMYPVHDC